MWPYDECLVAKVRNFQELRCALDEAERRMTDMAIKVDADQGTIRTSIKFSEEYSPYNRDDSTIIRFRWQMSGRRSPGDIVDDAVHEKYKEELFSYEQNQVKPLPNMR